MHHNDDLDAPDLRELADELRAARPRLTALELDATKRLVLSRAAKPARSRKIGERMKSRMAILMMLVLGMLLSTTGAGLAISGFSGANNDSASVAQYGVQDDDDGTLGEEDENTGDDNGGGGEGDGVAGTEDLQPTRQVEAGSADDGGGSLPFTGFAALPVLIGGVAMLGTGVALRKRSLRED